MEKMRQHVLKKGVPREGGKEGAKEKEAQQIAYLAVLVLVLLRRRDLGNRGNRGGLLNLREGGREGGRG
jgi:hypothetical protein